jgi:hypothetical protein
MKDHKIFSRCGILKKSVAAHSVRDLSGETNRFKAVILPRETMTRRDEDSGNLFIDSDKKRRILTVLFRIR